MTVQDRAEALGTLAEAWQDPEHDERSKAVHEILQGSERFTEEGLAFALNHAMQDLRDAAQGFREPAEVEACTVGVSPAAFDPLGGLGEAVAALLMGHDVMIESPTPPVARFLDALAELIGGEVTAATRGRLLDETSAWVVRSAADAPEDEAHRRTPALIPDHRILSVTTAEHVVVLTGKESHEMMSGLAEDLLLHEGVAPGTPRIVWAPRGMPPDTLLNALAGFRELYPAHPGTDGTFALPTAFLVSASRSHATGPGFLVSLGGPEAQAAGHIRWVEYDALSEIDQWLNAEGAPPRALVASEAAASQLDGSVPTIEPGDVHRRRLISPDLVEFLRAL